MLAGDLDLARYFEAAAQGAAKPKSVANWILNDLLRALTSHGINDRVTRPLAPGMLDELVNLIDEGKNQQQAREGSFRRRCLRAADPRARSCAERGIAQLSDTRALEELCDEVIAAHPKPVADFRAAKPPRSTSSKARF